MSYGKASVVSWVAEAVSWAIEQWRSRIGIEPGKRGGRPGIRGMRITVYDVLAGEANRQSSVAAAAAGW
jgi:uncharacterized protein (DUF433 family)